MLLGLVAPAAAERRTNGLALDVVCRCERPAWPPNPGDPVLEASVGVGRASFEAPASETRTTADVAGGFGAYVSPDLAVSLRGHVQVGTGPTTLTSIGLDTRWMQAQRGCKCRRGPRPRYFVSIGPAIGRVHGPGEVDALVALLEGRFGVYYRGAHVSIDVLAGHALANDSIAPEAALTWLSRAGISAGIDY